MAIRIREAGGVLAIYTVPTATSSDDTPLTDPITNISRVKFHSSFDYPGIVSSTDVTLSLPSMASNTTRDVTHQILAHGRSYVPWVEGGIIGLGGYNVAFQGHIPLHQGYNGMTRWVALGADATHVIVQESAIARYAASLPAITLTIRVHVMDR